LPQVLGLVVIGSSLGDTGEDAAGPAKLLTPIITDLTSKPDSDFKLPTELANTFVNLALGPDAESEARGTWLTLLDKTYAGEAGRVKLRQATTMVLSRDSLHLRAPDLKVPILWIHGSEDAVVTEKNARYGLSLTGSVDPRFEVVKGAPHSCHTTHPEVVNALLKDFVVKYGKKIDARALREAVGTVDI
jgi:pimeloyl-ACP methyl ester carboxylesterase